MTGMDGGFSISLASAPTPTQPGAAGPEPGVDSGFQGALDRNRAAPAPAAAAAAPVLAGPGLPAVPLMPEGAAGAVPGLVPTAATPLPALTVQATPEMPAFQATGVPAPEAPRTPPAAMLTPPSLAAAGPRPEPGGDGAIAMGVEVPATPLDSPEAVEAEPLPDPRADAEEEAVETAQVPLPQLSLPAAMLPAGGAGAPPAAATLAITANGAARPAAAPQAAIPPPTQEVPSEEDAATRLASAQAPSTQLAPTKPGPDPARPGTEKAAPDASGFPGTPEDEASVAELPSEAPLRLPPSRPPEGTPALAEPKPPEVRPPAPTGASASPGAVISWGFDAAAPRPVDAPPPAQGAPPTPPPAPVRQVAPIAVALAFTPGVANGFQLSLEPAELGRVEIRVQREGEAHSIRIVAERPETLALLLRDRQELDRSLADAGLLVEAKGIEFSLGPQSGQADQGAQGEQRPGASRRAAAGTNGQAEAEPPPNRALRGLLDLQI